MEMTSKIQAKDKFRNVTVVLPWSAVRPEYTMPCVRNLVEAKTNVSVFEFYTGIVYWKCLKIESGNFLMVVYWTVWLINAVTFLFP
jgi:hypothetical protein